MLKVLMYWSIAAVAVLSYTSANACITGDIRLRNEQARPGTISGGVEVCVNSSWTQVCHTGGWNSTALNGTSNNTRVACGQLGYREDRATFLFNRGGVGGIPRTGNGLRQGMCSGSELRLIDCPDLGDYGMCGQLDDNDIVRLTCRRATCDTRIRLRGGRTATEGRVEVCTAFWGTVCDDSWDENDASVACRQLGLTNFNAVALPAAFFGPGSSRISYSNLQCNGSEAALTDCTFDTIHQCSHNQDASVMCLVECSDEEVRIALDSEMNSVEYCNNQLWSTCDNACEDMNGVLQLGAYFCGPGEITHFLMNGSQLFECPISGAGEFLICEPTTQTLANNCQQLLQDIELQASSSSITVTWGNAEEAQIFDNSSGYEITCILENSDLQVSIVVEPTTSEVTVENLPHSTTYECCVALHIGRYSTRACSNTATLSDIIPSTSTTQTPCGSQNDSTAIQGLGLWVIIALGVLVVVLVLLLVLVTGAWLYYGNRIAALKSTLSDGDTLLSQNPSNALPPCESTTEPDYEVVDREQPDGAELTQNPAYRVHKTHPLQTNTDTVYATVEL